MRKFVALFHVKNGPVAQRDFASPLLSIDENAAERRAEPTVSRDLFLDGSGTVFGYRLRARSGHVEKPGFLVIFELNQEAVLDKKFF